MTALLTSSHFGGRNEGYCASPRYHPLRSHHPWVDGLGARAAGAGCELARIRTRVRRFARHCGELRGLLVHNAADHDPRGRGRCDGALRIVIGRPHTQGRSSDRPSAIIDIVIFSVTIKNLF